MNNRWTGGQYSLFRVVFALYLLAHFLGLLPCEVPSPNLLALSGRPVASEGLLAVGAVLCVGFGMGLSHRLTQSLCVLWAGLFVSDHRVRIATWLVVAQMAVPPAPYGSWAARGRIDPGAGWRMPPTLFAVAWIGLALLYLFSGAAKLDDPSWRDGIALAGLLNGLNAVPAWVWRLVSWAVIVFELAFALLGWWPRLRPWLWCVGLILQLPLFVLMGQIDWALGLVMAHLFTCDPGWIPPLSGGSERIFYDGHCGLCQRSVRLILAEDTSGSAFRFAPLQGETFLALVPPEQRAALPLSLVVQTEEGALLTRSAGVLHILRRLGGVWRLLAGVLFLLPPVVRDRLYDGVARIRLHLFAAPRELCPLMPSRLRTRFDP